ncbi:putative ABC transport system permease protein [Dyadobacter soli]|uniref:Putative ABC transport system permease protein n=1 Tax=Dyadobacter soli TaxID=659014 RepID=A0A1G7Q392_9BACT|nr:ABC transporter permease [Dyadobacter soli]SDF92080.1 putative ABC transport system permease protein [Dyadobacter soli]
MLKNYLKIAIRNLWRRKFYAAINIGGLAIGLAVCLTIVFYVKHEFSYDRHHDKSDRIVRITSKFETPDKPMLMANTPVLLASYLNKDYPEIEKTARLQIAQATVRHQQRIQNEQDVYFSEQPVFDVFTFTFLEGYPGNALRKPNTAVVTRTFALKYFGDSPALGRAIEINQTHYQITGVVADLPSNSDLKISVMLSRDFSGAKDWLSDDFPVYTFALFKQNPDLKLFDQKLRSLSQRYIQPELKAQGADGYGLIFQTEPLKDVHYSAGKMGDTPKGNKQYGYLFSFLALFVLIIAVLNYINLLTATAMERSREVGIRKANGARRGQLVSQFLFEFLIITAMSVLIGAALLKLSVPFLNSLLQINLTVEWSSIMVAGALSLLTITLLAGVYPSFILSSFKPVKALKGTLTADGHSAWLRKGITLFQFSIAVAMVFGVLVIRQQMKFLRNHNPGFDREQVLAISAPDDSAGRSKMNAFGAMLRQQSYVKRVTVGSNVMSVDETYPAGTTIFKANGRKKEVICNYFFIDEHFLPILNIKLLQGRNLSSGRASDRNGGFIVNEAFVKMSGWKNPVGQPIDGFFHKGEVIGVVKDFNYRSLHNAIEPLVMVYNTAPPASLMVKTKPDNLAAIERSWKSYYPDFPFEYRFLDSTFEAQYRKDSIMMMLFNIFAFLTVFVSCLGLLSLVTFSTSLRVKEIGIRKVLGASVSGIVTLLTREYLLIVMLAILLASPLAFYVMTRWLQSFAYHIEINWWLCVLAGLIALGIAVLTVSFQSIKAALANPVKSLQSE